MVLRICRDSYTSPTASRDRSSVRSYLERFFKNVKELYSKHRSTAKKKEHSTNVEHVHWTTRTSPSWVVRRMRNDGRQSSTSQNKETCNLFGWNTPKHTSCSSLDWNHFTTPTMGLSPTISSTSGGSVGPAQVNPEHCGICTLTIMRSLSTNGGTATDMKML